MSAQTRKWETQNLIAFWIFGICNNFVYVVMLTAAQDILKKHDDKIEPSRPDVCLENISVRQCTPQSAGIVLLCNILPALIIKAIYPLIGHWFPYGVRHAAVVVLQALALVITSYANSVHIALIGVMMGSLSGGLGEVTYLALASHYSKHTISTWSSGTGMAGIAGALSYAGLTDSLLLGLSPSQAMHIMLIVPLIFLLTYFIILEKPKTVKKVSIFQPQNWVEMNVPRITKTIEVQNENETIESQKFEETNKYEVVQSLLKYMIPLYFVYFAEYFINQGLLELTIFDCDHGYNTSPASQYRWYQVLYQVGVLISRSSITLIRLNMFGIAILPILQILNAIFFFFNAIYQFVPHFAIVSSIVLFEGFIGGASYVNSFHHIHKKMKPEIREFALSTTSLADTIGILSAALAAIPIHNMICAMTF